MNFKYERVKRKAFAVFGVEGSGFVEESDEWTSELWYKLDAQTEVLTLLLDCQETEFTYWGIMSDKEEWLEPWADNGRYLAGVEVPLDTKEHSLFSKWVLPAMEYLLVKTSIPYVQEAVAFIFEEVVEKDQIEIVGAIQECYPAFSDLGDISLYFPIQILSKEDLV